MPTEKSRTLLLATLTIRSSYMPRFEEPAVEAFDTIQFWLTPADAWRIRTFVVDHDLHVHHLSDFSESSGDREKVLLDHVHRMYAEILGEVYILELEDGSDEDEVRRVFEENGLTGELERTEAGFAFYNPDGGEYQSKSEPLR